MLMIFDQIKKFNLLTLLALAFLILWLIMAMFPFIWTLWGSFKVQGDFFSKQDVEDLEVHFLTKPPAVEDLNDIQLHHT